MQFSAFLFRRCLFQPRWQISLNAAGTGALNANHRAVFAQRPLHHCQGTKKQVQTELCWLYGPLQIFSGIWEYYVLTHQNERETFYHFSLLSSRTCPHTQPLLCTHIWKRLSDKHQNASLLMSSRRALCSHWTMTEGSLCSWQRGARAGTLRQEQCDESWGLYQQAIPPSSLSLWIPSLCFLFMGRKGLGEHQPPRLWDWVA